MAKRMLIDAAHPEETRVVVLNGNRLEEFDFESSTKKQVKGNIYLAKITRVEPSLQAAFVDYGGNRHGFLAFSEIHPDYYRIPVGDRTRDGGEQPTSETVAEPAGGDEGVPLAEALPEPVTVPDTTAEEEAAESTPSDEGGNDAADHAAEHAFDADENRTQPESSRDFVEVERSPSPEPPAAMAVPEYEPHTPSETHAGDHPEPYALALASAEETVVAGDVIEAEPGIGGTEDYATPAAVETVETIGGDEAEEDDEDEDEAEAQIRRTRSLRHYKIQEVIKRRQIMLVQVTKEERGNKGAALTTYLSLAGRYCVLMPNTARGGGVSRKITSVTDRRRLKEILEELEIPEGMGVIVRTAGAERSKAEIKRDYEYLLRLWNEIRDLTLKSTAPALIYEEGNLIKRSIRDLYTRDIDEVQVEGEEGYKTAKAFMRTLIPSHAKRVQPYRDPQIGLLHRFQVESQIDAIHSPVAQLRSGGYIVINQTEALVAIDVNSGRSTRERNIEETALRTNLEAADEVARQLRLRDLAGLIVIDFIDMEEHRNQVAVERRLKEALKNDRARIQVGRISPFGLLEMSRQRLRPSLAEASTQPCPHCGGTGFIRSVESTALYVLRSIEEEGIRRRSAEICVYVPTTVALYILNQKRESLTQIEARYAITVMIARDDLLIPPNFRLERLRAYGAGEAPPPPSIRAPTIEEAEEEEVEADEEVEAPEAVRGGAAEAEAGGGEDEGGRRRRRRRRGRRDEGRERRPAAAHAEAETAAEPERTAAEDGEHRRTEDGEHRREESDSERRRRRRGRRGGRTRGRRDGAENGAPIAAAAETIEILPGPGHAAPEPPEFEAPQFETAVPWSSETGLEAASLAPLAGDSAAPEPHPAAAEPAAIAAAEPEPAPAPVGEAEPGIPFVSETERVLEQAERSAGNGGEHRTSELPRHVSSVPEDVRDVTDKPVNPKRGWWQRLTQS
ncbi:MAG TPA: ribonuclease E/G [Stellaceae bacterium]|jgi:ribonuclease E|nr:ribonuclease E/G [Stellaceae bacterium]